MTWNTSGPPQPWTSLESVEDQRPASPSARRGTESTIVDQPRYGPPFSLLSSPKRPKLISWTGMGSEARGLRPSRNPPTLERAR